MEGGFKLKFLPLEDLRCVLSYLCGMTISKLLLCGDKRIEHLILKGGAVEALSFNFPVDHPRPYLPQFVYLVSKLKVLSIIAAENDVTGIDLQRLPSSLEFLIFRFQALIRFRNR